jgi:hypothetical protein
MHSDDARRDHNHPPIAIDAQNRQRRKHMEVQFGHATALVDKQPRIDHKRRADDQSREQAAWLGACKVRCYRRSGQPDQKRFFKGVIPKRQQQRHTEVRPEHQRESLIPLGAHLLN